MDKKRCSVSYPSAKKASSPMGTLVLIALVGNFNTFLKTSQGFSKKAFKSALNSVFRSEVSLRVHRTKQKSV